jgi:uncharacterized protein (DUF2147 family)
MGVTAHLNNSRLGVEPGGETACEVQVRNAGSVVDQFTVDVVGFAKEWAVIEPPTINLFPGAEATARVVFRPPRSSQVQAGPVPFGVRVLSREDPRGSVVEEGVVEVAPFSDLKVELVPQRSRGRRSARHQLAVDNNGNRPLSAEVVAVDPENELQIRVDPPTLLAEPGTTTLVRTRIRPNKRFLKGPPQTHPFQLLVVPDGGEAATADGVMTQEQLLPKWLLPAVAALFALALAGLVLWLTLVRPAIKSLAREQAAQQVKQVADTASQAKQSAAAAQQTAASASQKADDAVAKNGTGSGTGSSTTKPTDASGNTALNTGTPTTFRVTVQANKVTDGSFTSASFTAPSHQKLNIFDLLLQNPRGDAGILQIKQGGNVLLEEGLANYRDSDQHFQVPWSFDKDQPVVVSVNCTQPGPGATQCTSGVLFSGRLVK